MRRYGIRLQEWRVMSDDDRYEYLAYDREYQDTLERMLRPFTDRIKDKEPIDATSFYALLALSL